VATLVDIRKKFIVASRRYDLITDGDLDTNTDNGANDFINEGQRYLDLVAETPKSLRHLMVVLAEGEFSVEIEGLMQVKSVTVIDSTDGHSNITDGFMGVVEFRNEHPSLISEWDTGTPVDWTLNIIGLAPEQNVETAETFASAGVLDYDAVHFEDDYDYTGLLFYPVADQDYTIDLIGRFMSPKLSANTDVSYWTKRFPGLLVQASCYALARTLKNQAGMRAWLEAMDRELNALDNMTVESTMVDTSFTGYMEKF